MSANNANNANKGSSEGRNPDRKLAMLSRKRSEVTAEIKDGNRSVGKMKDVNEERIYKDENGNRYIYNQHYEEEIFGRARNTPSGGHAQQNKGKGKEATSDKSFLIEIYC
jgi:hypothetical protein